MPWIELVSSSNSKKRDRKRKRRIAHFNVVGGRNDEDRNARAIRIGGCPHCLILLHYDQDRNVKWCLQCGWNSPKDFDTNNNDNNIPITENNNNKPKVSIATSDDPDNASMNPDDEIHIAFKGSRSDELKSKQDPYSYLRKDDAPLRRHGYSLVRDEVSFSDNKTTLSGTELEHAEM
jgi:hypothetical protein